MVPKILQSKKDTIGLRIPDNKIALAIINELGRPILSASLPGEMVEDYTDPEIMHENFINEVDIVIDGGIGGVILLQSSTVPGRTGGIKNGSRGMEWINKQQSWQLCLFEVQYFWSHIRSKSSYLFRQ